MTFLISAIFASFSAKSRLYHFSELLMNSSSPPQIWIAEQRRRLWRRPDFSRGRRSRSPEGSGGPSGSWRAPREKSSARLFARYSVVRRTRKYRRPRVRPSLIRKSDGKIYPFAINFQKVPYSPCPTCPPYYAQKSNRATFLTPFTAFPRTFSVFELPGAGKARFLIGKCSALRQSPPESDAPENAV